MKRVVLLFILFNILASISFAHPGRTDSNGGHYDRSTGEYHYHDGNSAGQGTNRENVITENEVVKVTNDSDSEKKRLEELIYSKQNTIGKLNNTITEKDKEIKRLKNYQTYMWIGFGVVFVVGIYISYKRGLNKKDS